MSDILIQSLTITIPLSILLVMVHYLQIRQLKGIESRLSKEIKASTDRLCADIRDLRNRVVAWIGECYTDTETVHREQPSVPEKPQSR